MHQMVLLDSSAVSSPARWHLRILVLLLGITILHVWAGPALSDSSGVPAQAGSLTTTTQQASVSSAAPILNEVLHKSSSSLLGPSLGQDALAGDVCAAACPDGHLVATALCSMVLVVADFMGLYCLRAMFFIPGGNMARELLPSAPAPPRLDGVSLLQLSISRI